MRLGILRKIRRIKDVKRHIWWEKRWKPL